MASALGRSCSEGRSRFMAGLRESTKGKKRSYLVRARVAALLTVLLTAAGMLTMAATPASAQQSFPGSAVFSAYTTGTQQHVTALQPMTTRVVNVDTSLAGATANSQGLGKAITSDTNAVVQP